MDHLALKSCHLSLYCHHGIGCLKVANWMIVRNEVLMELHMIGLFASDGSHPVLQAFT